MVSINNKTIFHVLENVVLFCSVTVGRIAWFNNWIAFMDNMLQIQILGEDTRSLFVPTSIDKLVINVKKHFLFLQSLPEENPGNLYLYIFIY